MFLQQLLNGLTMGSIYALVAIGITMIYKSMGMLNVAHGDTIMISAFFALTFYMMGFPVFLAIIGSVACIFIYGLVSEKFVYRKLQYDSFTNLLIATIGMSIILRNASIVIWGAEPRLFPSIFSTKPIEIGGYLILPQNIGIIAISAMLMVLLQLFFYKTRIGKSMRAAATDPEAASIMGIDVSFTRFLTFGISSGLGAIAGVLLAPIFYVTPDMGATVVLKGFAAAIMGGFGSVVGAMVGGPILGIIEAVGAGYLSSAYRDVIAFTVLIVILYFKPSGLLVKKHEQKL